MFILDLLHPVDNLMTTDLAAGHELLLVRRHTAITEANINHRTFPTQYTAEKRDDFHIPSTPNFGHTA